MLMKLTPGNRSHVQDDRGAKFSSKVEAHLVEERRDKCNVIMGRPWVVKQVLDFRMIKNPSMYVADLGEQHVQKPQHVKTSRAILFVENLAN